jgi:hypothetical protein
MCYISHYSFPDKIEAREFDPANVFEVYIYLVNHSFRVNVTIQIENFCVTLFCSGEEPTLLGSVRFRSRHMQQNLLISIVSWKKYTLATCMQ